MTNENNSPDTQQQNDSKISEVAERKQMSRIADEFAGRAKQRQFQFDEEHNIFTK